MYRRWLVLTGLVFGLTTALFSQRIADGETQPGTGGQAAPTEPPKAGGISMNTYDPVAQIDPRFTVTGLNFDRRYSPNGLGEFLDVVFDVNNLTSKNVDLRVFIAAFYETTSVLDRQREMVPYPSWRDRDYEREQSLVKQMIVTPADIPESRIWDKTDPDYHRYYTTINRMRNSLGGDEPITDPRPPFWKYLQFMMEHPNEGLLMTLHGDNSPTSDKALQSNYPQPSAEELKIGIHKSIYLHKYTIEHTRRKTMVRSHHYSNFRADYHYFNRVAIVIFDATRADAYMQQKKDGVQEGDEPIVALVYKKVFEFDKPLRNN